MICLNLLSSGCSFCIHEVCTITCDGRSDNTCYADKEECETERAGEGLEAEQVDEHDRRQRHVHACQHNNNVNSTKLGKQRTTVQRCDWRCEPRKRVRQKEPSRAPGKQETRSARDLSRHKHNFDHTRSIATRPSGLTLSHISIARVVSVEPVMGGPMIAAEPWKSRVRPNELMSTCSPSRSTRTTDVIDTYTPEKHADHSSGDTIQETFCE